MTTPTRPRPAVVTTAVLLMTLTVIALIIDAAALIAGAGDYPDRVAAAVRASGVDPRIADTMSSFATGVSVIAIGVTLVAAVILTVLAVLTARGSFAARIVTWVAIGLALMCNVCGIGSAGAGFSGIAYVNAFSVDSSGRHTFAQRLPDGYPDWYQPLSLTLALIGVVALIIACVLLALPAANAYFRKVKPVPAGGWMVPGNPGPIAPDQGARLAELNRRYQRGELTTDEYMAEQNHILGR